MRFVLVVRIYLIYNEINVRGGGMMEGNYDESYGLGKDGIRRERAG